MNYNPNQYPKCTVPAADVARVKGLGFLRDKTTPDCFNARVITRKGKITADEMYAIADAARRFGSGEVALPRARPPRYRAFPLKTFSFSAVFLPSTVCKWAAPVRACAPWSPARARPACSV